MYYNAFSLFFVVSLHIPVINTYCPIISLTTDKIFNPPALFITWIMDNVIRLLLFTIYYLVYAIYDVISVQHAANIISLWRRTKELLQLSIVMRGINCSELYCKYVDVFFASTCCPHLRNPFFFMVIKPYLWNMKKKTK